MEKTFGIGQAVKEMRDGHKVRRQGWNGKGMWLALFHSDKVGLPPSWQPFVGMHTAQGTLVPWLCSQSDLLATDWEIVD
jgi:hypothetical protein